MTDITITDKRPKSGRKAKVVGAVVLGTIDGDGKNNKIVLRFTFRLVSKLIFVAFRLLLGRHIFVRSWWLSRRLSEKERRKMTVFRPLRSSFGKAYPRHLVCA